MKICLEGNILDETDDWKDCHWKEWEKHDVNKLEITW
jgi:hypothetical protein